MIRPLVIVAAAAAFAGAVVVAIEGRTADELVSRRSVTTAFARVGEPLIVRIDMAQADPGSPVDVIYVPVAEDVPEPPFEVNLFEHARSAREHARLVESVAGPGTEVEQRKNVLLIYSSSVSDQRRERIVGALRSLQVALRQIRLGLREVLEPWLALRQVPRKPAHRCAFVLGQAAVGMKMEKLEGVGRCPASQIAERGLFELR